MKYKIKNSKNKYLPRASLPNLEAKPTQDEDSENERNDDNQKFLHAVIEESWYINFNINDKG